MGFSLKSLRGKFDPSKKKQQAEAKKREQEKEDSEQQASRLDIAAKMNMLDAKLSMINIDTLLRSGELDNDAGELNKADMMKSIANEQEAENFKFLLESADLSASDKIDSFPKKNKDFLSASQKMSVGYDRFLGLDNGRGYRVYPIAKSNDIVVADSVLIKLQAMISGMDEKRMFEKISSMMPNRTSAVEFVQLLQKNYVSTQGSISAGRGNEDEKKMYELALECAEYNFQERMKEQQKTQTANVNGL
jgi:hypothetical protein